MNVSNSKNGVSVRAYKGDAMTLLAIDLDKKQIDDFTGFSIRVTPPGAGMKSFYLFNRLIYADAVLKKSGIDPKKVDATTMEFAPLQRFRWVHTPATNHNTKKPIYGGYRYEITPRYLIDDVLQPLNATRTVALAIDVSPYRQGALEIGFTRGFIESQAYTRHFGSNNAMRPNKTDLIFDIGKKAGPPAADKKKHPDMPDYTFEDQHKWLGWQARQRVLDFLAEVTSDPSITLDVFAFDLNEPLVCDALIGLAKEGRVRVILDDSTEHTAPADLERKFAKLFTDAATDPTSLVRGHFGSLAHTKVFIQKRKGKAVKVLTGSTNFSTNGLYVNANHVIIFGNASVAQLYEQVFVNSFGAALMKDFKNTETAVKDFAFAGATLPTMTIRFSPHTKVVAEKFFAAINKRILGAKSDVLFAIMNDHSKSSILDAVKTQVHSDTVFTYGITDVVGKNDSILLYKPNSKRGVRIAGKPGDVVLPPPFDKESKIPGVSIHHKFVVVDFKGTNPVAYCGSSNLAFGPEQANGDNLIEIRDTDAVTVFAIEAIRLVDHFHFRNKMSAGQTGKKKPKPINLHDSSESGWVKPYYDTDDLLSLERTLLIAP